MRVIRILSLALIFAAAVVFGLASDVRPRPAGRAQAQDSVVAIDPDIALRLTSQPWVRVNIALTEEPGARSLAERPSMLSEIAGVQERALASLAAPDFQLIYRYEGIAGLTGLVSSSGLARLARHPDVAAVTVDGVGSGALGQSVPLINADDVHALGKTGAGVTVAVLDSGANLNSVDLADAIAYERCYLAGGGCPGGGTVASGPGSSQDDHGHGTNVTGIITSNGNAAPKGVAPDALIGSYKVLNAANSGFFSDWNAALSDIIANHPEVQAVNMSLVSPGAITGDCDTFQPTTTSAINTLRASGTLTFISSGNNAAKSGMTFPACIAGAISVGAVWDATSASQTFFGCTDAPANADQVTCWSNSDTGLDVLAPGALITSTGLWSPTSTFLGTSQAAPHATGLAALLRQANPTLSAAQIETQMESTGVPRTDPANGRVTPRIDAFAALTQPDADNDIVLDMVDNCPGVTNPQQENDDSRRLGVGAPQPDRTNPHADAPGNACDADDDNDGRSDVDETAAGTCPGLAHTTLAQCHAAGVLANPLIADTTDTDGDVFTDGYESLQGSDPLSAASRTCTLGDCTDTDADGVPNSVETGAGSNPALADTDGDGLSDGIELRHRATSPLLADTDGGGCSDRREVFSIDANSGVGFGDLLLFAAAYSATGPALGAPSSTWDANKDYNGNSTVGFSDLLIFAAAYGLSCAAGVDLAA